MLSLGSIHLKVNRQELTPRCSSHFTFKQRNFDPETRQSRLREKGDAGEDTVEKAVEGLAEQIIKEDEEKRKALLAGTLFMAIL